MVSVSQSMRESVLELKKLNEGKMTSSVVESEKPSLSTEPVVESEIPKSTSPFNF